MSIIAELVEKLSAFDISAPFAASATVEGSVRAVRLRQETDTRATAFETPNAPEELLKSIRPSQVVVAGEKLSLAWVGDERIELNITGHKFIIVGTQMRVTKFSTVGGKLKCDIRALEDAAFVSAEGKTLGDHVVVNTNTKVHINTPSTARYALLEVKLDRFMDDESAECACSSMVLPVLVVPTAAERDRIAGLLQKRASCSSRCCGRCCGASSCGACCGSRLLKFVAVVGIAAAAYCLSKRLRA